MTQRTVLINNNLFVQTLKNKIESYIQINSIIHYSKISQDFVLGDAHISLFLYLKYFKSYYYILHIFPLDPVNSMLTPSQKAKPTIQAHFIPQFP